MDNNTVFDDLMQALHEVEEHQKGSTQLRSNRVTLLTDEIAFYEVYGKLTDSNKRRIMKIAEELLQTSS